MMESLPTLTTIFGEQYQRLRGINSWLDLTHLGNVNLIRLQQLAQQTILSLMAGPHDTNDLRAIKQAIDYIGELTTNAVRKPLLPRLRVENFQLYDRVMIYLRDTPGYLGNSDWQRATITNISKAHNQAWVDGSANSGYYWRVTATSDHAIFINTNSLNFSTSEPRVLPEWEFNYLRQTQQSDAPFLTIFAANAWRNWSPLWCLEREITIDANKIDYHTWLVGS